MFCPIDKINNLIGNFNQPLGIIPFYNGIVMKNLNSLILVHSPSNPQPDRYCGIFRKCAYRQQFLGKALHIVSDNPNLMRMQNILFFFLVSLFSASCSSCSFFSTVLPVIVRIMDSPHLQAAGMSANFFQCRFPHSENKNNPSQLWQLQQSPYDFPHHCKVPSLRLILPHLYLSYLKNFIISTICPIHIYSIYYIIIYFYYSF